MGEGINHKFILRVYQRLVKSMSICHIFVVIFWVCL